MQKPDLRHVDPEIITYIEFLERKAGVSRSTAARSSVADEEDQSVPRTEPLPAERETSAHILTITREGLAKRTQRHLYTRQHRAGMGVFGIDLVGDDSPRILAAVDESQNLLFFTNRARVFRQALSSITQAPINGRGDDQYARFGLEQDEHLIAVLPEQAKGYVALAAESGYVRCLRHHLFGEHMRPGTPMFNANEMGALVSVAWTPGDAELFLLTENGIGIRFAEKALKPQGERGINLSSSDRLVSVTSIYEDSGVLMMSADGRGTVRMMTGFAANKTPGGNGKIAFKSNRAIGAVTIEANDDIFAISRLGKMVRFPVDEVPTTEGVVQGVNCMGLRGDEVVAVLRSGPIY